MEVLGGNCQQEEPREHFQLWPHISVMMDDDGEARRELELGKEWASGQKYYQWESSLSSCCTAFVSWR